MAGKVDRGDNFVFGDNFRAVSSGEMLRVSRSMSANTGVPPSQSAAVAVEAKVSGDVKTSSPSPTPAAKYAHCRAAVPEETTTACLTPHRRASASSKADT